MTRVAMVAGTYRPECCGVAHYTERLRAALDAYGISSVVLTTREAAREAGDSGVRGVVGGWRAPDLPPLVRAVVRAEHEGADVIHIQHAAGTYNFKRALFFLPPLLRAAGVRAPLVTTVHEYGWWEWEPWGVPSRVTEMLKEWGQHYGWWDREDGFLLTGSDALLTTNTHAETAIVGRLPWLASRLRRVPLAANVDVAPVTRNRARDEARSRHGWPPDAEVLAYFGFLHPVKGIETLLEAHRELLKSRPKARLLLIGGVESLALCAEEAAWYRNKLRTLVEDLGLEGRVEMTGYLPEEEASRLLSGSDLGVLPFNEGVTLKSGALLTLFAHGLPVVATRPDPPDPALTDGGRLRLVDRRDAPGLAATLLGMLADEPERARLREAGRAYTRNLSWPTIAERHVEAYESVLAGRRNASGLGSVRQAGTPFASAFSRVENSTDSGTDRFPDSESG